MVKGGQLSPVERILVDKEYFGLPGTPVQRSIARAIDAHRIGRNWNNPDVRAAFGGEQPIIYRRKGLKGGDEPAGSNKPREVVICAGIRGGKSMLAAATAWQRCLECDLSWWTPKEAPPVFPILSVRKANAQAVYQHVRGLATHTPLRQYVVGEPGAESLVIKHPETGCHITLSVKAGSRAASSLASFWLVGAIFDEAFKMTGREESVLNLEDAQVEVRERIIPGGQIIYVGSPWRPEGPAYRMVRDYFGQPTLDRLVIRATGPMLNPKHWNAKRVARLEESQDAQDREIYRTSVLGEFLEADEALISLEEIDAVTRVSPLEQPPIDGVEYVAAMDPAARKNAWTLVIAGRWEPHRVGIAVAREWVPTGKSRLDPGKVMAEIAELCARYNLGRIMTDRWSVDAMRVIAAQHGLTLAEMSDQGIRRFHDYDRIRVMIQKRDVELPALETLQRDLMRLVKRATADAVKIYLPETSDGRHCDFAPPLAMVLAHPPRWKATRGPETLDDAEEYAKRLQAKDGDDWLDGLAEGFSGGVM